MKNIIDVYNEYKIMPNLQSHQLRVASVTKQICESMTVSIDTETLVTTALIHDMGNIIKFKLDYFPVEFYEPKGGVYWKSVQDEFKEKYGSDEHVATLAIARELSLPSSVIDLANENLFSLLCTHRDSDDIGVKILHYADMRVGPYGVISYDERIEDGHKRYKDHKNSVAEEERNKLVNCGRDIEKQIFAQSKIKPEDITDLSVAPYIEELKKFSI